MSASVEPKSLLSDPTIKAALAAIERNEPETLNEQARITEIPAPPFAETVRGLELKRLFEKLGLKDVRIDKVGNVIGVRPGALAKPSVVVAAHLDTVFPEGTDVRVKRDGKMLRGPGIGDDGRGLAAMLSVIRALDEGGVKTTGTITFVADVGEEGLGDLRGVKALFNDTLKGNIDSFISIEPGSPGRIINAGVGSYRYRVTFKGPGGHSYGAFGMANPIHALGRAIAKIGDIKVPAAPKTTFNVGRINGGTSVNSIAFESWFEVDMRSETMVALDAVKEQFNAAVADAVKVENARWNNRGAVTVDIDLVGLRPAGLTPEDSAIVKTAGASVVAIGGIPSYGAGSTDSNVPMQLGIPAVTLGGGGVASGAHSLTEAFDSTDSHLGPQAVLLTVVALVR
ncbi:MAG: M20/M25/M40 family metallo-hydrolase [Undibacterium sp.]|nr:M20/M25/M40 family metallo-hydrolase [Opitutaceae bacterium]